VKRPTASGSLATGSTTLRNLPSGEGLRLYLSAQKLNNSLFRSSPTLPDPLNPSVDGDVPYSYWEYTLNNQGFTWDVSYVNEWSYPLQTVVTPAGGKPTTYGLASFARAIKQLISQPSFISKQGSKAGKGKAGDLVWQTTPPGWPSGTGDQVNNKRIVGPLTLWQLQQGGGNLNLLPQAMQSFLAAVPQDGNDFNASQTNLKYWNQALSITNGYTAALAAQARLDGGVNPQPQTGTPKDFRGFFTYPQDEDFGQVTFGRQPDRVIVNDINTDAHVFGSSGPDRLSGSRANNVIVGGFGQDRLTGGGGRNRYAYVRADSSLAGRRNRDVITDFNLRRDVIDLSAVDANAKSESHQAFRWRGERSFTGRPGQLRVHFSDRGFAVLRGDTRGNGKADFAIQLTNLEMFSPENLLL
jgi:hypothetical protein